MRGACGKFCDLHLHSDRSDGTVSPRGVVELARRAGLAAMALTDHDTFDGVDEAVDAGKTLGVDVVAGVELSLEHAGTFHLIALLVDHRNPRIRAVAERLRDGRGVRNRQILRRLRELGVGVSDEEVAAEVGGPVVGRPHIAQALLRKGHVRSIQDAFDRYLGKGAGAYVGRDRVTLEEAAAATRAAGGATVLCHPYTLGYDRSTPRGTADLRQFLLRAVERGVDAVEVRYGSYSRSQERYWESMAREAGLLFSGGSDFHGAVKPGLKVGRGRGRMRVPLAWLDALRERAAR